MNLNQCGFVQNGIVLNAAGNIFFEIGREKEILFELLEANTFIQYHMDTGMQTKVKKTTSFNAINPT